MEVCNSCRLYKERGRSCTSSGNIRESCAAEVEMGTAANMVTTAKVPTPIRRTQMRAEMAEGRRLSKECNPRPGLCVWGGVHQHVITPPFYFKFLMLLY